jgi:hypothetical protein
MASDLTLFRRAFWAFFAEAAPALHARTERGNESSRWLAVGNMPLVIVHYLSAGGVGIFVRGARGTRIGHVREYLFPQREFLAEALGREDLRLGTAFLLESRLKRPMRDEANWPAAAAWLAGRSPLYERALARVQGR